MKRILVLRGGAIGDFVLSLPAIKLLRDAFPAAQIEILGYRHIIALAEKRYYADAVRSIEYAKMAGFFTKEAELSSELCGYFGSFDLIVSYLFDPDGIFAANLDRCCRGQILVGPGKLDESDHATQQLARPMQTLCLSLTDRGARLFPNEQDRTSAAKLLPDDRRLIAIHPGSGSAKKNWPIESWIALLEEIARNSPPTDFVIVGGEADDEPLSFLRANWRLAIPRFVIHQPLPVVAAVIEQCDHFLGHDSGISHLAAAVGANCTLLFGPSNPDVWAPQNRNVQIIRSGSKRVADLEVAEVFAAITS